jgi:transposase
MCYEKDVAGKTLKLDRPEVAGIIDEKHRVEKPGWRKDRLLAIKLAARGEHTAAEIAEIAGMARSQVFAFVKAVREGGLEAIWEKSRGGRPEGDRKGIPGEVSAEFGRKLVGHEFAALQDARRWLRQEHGLEVAYQRVWYWAKKLGGVLRVPPPSHSRKSPAAAEEFRGNLEDTLESLGLAPGTRAKVWVMDEARFALRTMLRKLWTPRGNRPGVTCQTKYEWDYLYGSLEVTGGEAHFCEISGVNLGLSLIGRPWPQDQANASSRI